jgi:general secretion pathway protein A
MSSHVIGLKSVFANTSDPHCFFESQTHTHALQLLSDPGEEALNIRVLVGDPGTGKTMLLLSLLERFESAALTTRLFWTQLRRGEFLDYFLYELGIPRPSSDIREAQEQFRRVLQQNFSRGRDVVIAVDEAHELDIATLGVFDELLDCPLGRSKQLRIILAGLPLLESTLASPGLRQLRDRISGFHSLTPLTSEESASYIKQRLELSGLRIDQRFTEDAIALIAKLSHGIPREINNICFEVVYRAEQRGQNPIDADVVIENVSPENLTRAWTEAQEAPPAEAGRPVGALHPRTAAFPSTKQPPVLVSGGVSEEFSNCVSEWFGYERLAWSGTAGELATSLQQPEAGLMQSLNSSSEALRRRGIGLSVVESCGRTTAVCLRSLETREKNKAETRAAEPILELPEPAFDENGESGTALIENETHQLPAHHAPELPLDDSLQTGTVPASPFDKTLERLVTLYFDQFSESPRSRLRQAILPVLLSIVALGVLAFIGLLLTRHHFNRASAQHPTPTLSLNSSVPGQQGNGTSPKDVKPDLTFNGEQESTENVKAPVESSASLLRAARSGDPKAQFDLGVAYVNGDGVPQDAVTGYTWLTLAFTNGNKQAETLLRELSRTLNTADIARVRWNLGEMYANGIGVRPDKVTAYMWHLLAELSGETRSRVATARLARSMTTDEKSQAQSRASEWLRKHQTVAEKGELTGNLN